MSSLQRYKKSGGFFQLLSLIETFGPQKKEKFLEVVDSESRVWGQALRTKMLTLERIFSWPDQVVIEVYKHLPPKSQAFCMQGLKDEYKAKIMPFLSAADQRRLNDVLTESQPKPEEIQTTLVKLLEVARKLIHDKVLHPEKFDEGLIISEDFESKLEMQGAAAFGGDSAPTTYGGGNGNHTPAAASVVIEAPVPNANAPAEVYQLQRTLNTVMNENKALKAELQQLKGKLDQIRKIA